MKKVGSFFTLLTSKGYKKVVLIPLAFCLGFFLYSLLNSARTLVTLVMR